MTVSMVPLMKGKTVTDKTGKGMKMVLAIVTIEPSAEALHPDKKWLDMRSIKAVFPMKGIGLGSMMVLVNVVGPGSVGNYASLTLRHMRNDASVIALGTPATGTITTPMLIVGE